MIFKNNLIENGRPLTRKDIGLVHPELHIKKGRSAYELWEKVFDNGSAAVPVEILYAIKDDPIFGGLNIEELIPEHNTNFDNYGKGRQHDLLITGVSARGEVVIGVEAKVDERFGNQTAEQYFASGLEIHLQGKNSNKPYRITDLKYALFEEDQHTAAEELQYQLIQATAGVLAEATHRKYNHALFVIYNLVPQKKTSEYIFNCNENNKALDRFTELISKGKYKTLELNKIAGPIMVKGNEFINPGIPLHLLKVEAMIRN